MLCVGAAAQAQYTRVDTLAADPYDFWMAADTGNLDMVRICVEKGIYVDVAFEDNVTPLMLAVQSGHLEIVKYLLSKGANLNACSDAAKIPVLTSAVVNNDLYMAELLIRHGSRIAQVDAYGMQALHYAASYGFYYMADMLLYYDAPADEPDSSGNTPLYYAVISGDTAIVQLLVSKGASLQHSGENLGTMMHTAAQSNNFEMVKFLYQAGLSIETKNESNLSVYDEFTIQGNPEALNWLAGHGLGPSDSITRYFNTRNLANISGNREVKKMIKSSGIKPLRRPYFNYLGIAFQMPFNLDDIFLGLKTDLYDTRYGLQFSLGAMIRPGSKAVWVEQNAGVYYQLLESRYCFSAGVYKHFRLPQRLNFPVHLVLGVDQVFTDGKYKSIEGNNPAFLIVSPTVGIYVKFNKNSGLQLAYSYMPLHNDNISPHRISLGIRTSINIKGHTSDFDNYYIIKE